mgnify:CR=1 FL=1|tara:strand:+ start:822 stop:1088 length:267 start_codon:yes stop_codon:yes gene_type:complete
MKPIAINVYILMMFVSYVIRRTGTFSMEEKVKMIEFLSYMAAHPDSRIEAHGGVATLLGEVMQYQPSQVGHLRAPSQASKIPEYIPHP